MLNALDTFMRAAFIAAGFSMCVRASTCLLNIMIRATAELLMLRRRLSLFLLSIRIR